MASYCFSSADKDGLQFFSQWSQDQYLNENIFKKKKNGVFVDIGAYDGITGSNTLFFEKFMGWSGVCIEPIPQSFELLKNARKAKCIQGCICSGRDTASFLHIKGYSEMLSGILDKYDPEHLARVSRELVQFGQSSETITVKCYDLTKLLLENSLPHVDYLSIDTEGGELEILKSINFQLIDIDVIDVENNCGTDKFQTFLQPLGYILVTKLGADEIYVKSGPKRALE